MPVELQLHQKDALAKMHNGCILCGGVGSGKSITALAYYWIKVCGGNISFENEITPPMHPLDLYIITTARKRDTHDWEQECSRFMIDKDPKYNCWKINLVIDSWNNIAKYLDITDAFFIFDEQRAVGKGVWAKSFIKIAKKNKWVMLSATPGDTWMDYIPVFLANKFYKNRQEFLAEHVVFKRGIKFPVVERYLNEELLLWNKSKVLVDMDYKKKTYRHYKVYKSQYPKLQYKMIKKNRFNPERENAPCRSIGEWIGCLRKLVNTHWTKTSILDLILADNPKIILFYNFDYELELILKYAKDRGIEIAQWNGHQHDSIPRSEKWIYALQYAAGSEGWNCVTTNVIVFFSLSYSYKVMEQSCGRIDRLNTPYKDLYYYLIISDADIDQRILDCLKHKKDFNERDFS